MHYNDEFFQVQISTAYSYEKLKQLANAIVSSAKILQSKYLLWSNSALDLTLLILSNTCIDTARCVMASRLVEHMGKDCHVGATVNKLPGVGCAHQKKHLGPNETPWVRREVLKIQ